MTASERHLYNAGRDARLSGRPTRVCPYGITDLCRRHWWLAGWNDQDIEIRPMEAAA